MMIGPRSDNNENEIKSNIYKLQMNYFRVSWNAWKTSLFSDRKSEVKKDWVLFCDRKSEVRKGVVEKLFEHAGSSSANRKFCKVGKKCLSSSVSKKFLDLIAKSGVKYRNINENGIKMGSNQNKSKRFTALQYQHFWAPLHYHR